MFKLLGTLTQQASSPPEVLYPEYGSMSRSPSYEEQDHPPKYEDVEQFPPQYEMPPDYEEAVGSSDTDKLIEQTEWTNKQSSDELGIYTLLDQFVGYL